MAVIALCLLLRVLCHPRTSDGVLLCNDGIMESAREERIRIWTSCRPGGGEDYTSSTICRIRRRAKFMWCLLPWLVRRAAGTEDRISGEDWAFDIRNLMNGTQSLCTAHGGWNSAPMLRQLWRNLIVFICHHCIGRSVFFGWLALRGKPFFQQLDRTIKDGPIRILWDFGHQLFIGRN